MNVLRQPLAPLTIEQMPHPDGRAQVPIVVEQAVRVRPSSAPSPDRAGLPCLGLG